MGMIWVVIGFAIGFFFGYCESKDKWYLKGRKDGYRKGREDAEWHHARRERS